ncbi:hypothetical protein DFH11DRAFT_1877912 [Phellopilus nigrolimitatus]|nr:hypothetical protein DFH11DRAFT_1877912 [Phellopilus nigrolimitatus]
MIELLNGHSKRMKSLPVRVVVFRGGVSDGQFDRVFINPEQRDKNSNTKAGTFVDWGHYASSGPPDDKMDEDQTVRRAKELWGTGEQSWWRSLSSVLETRKRGSTEREWQGLRLGKA